MKKVNWIKKGVVILISSCMLFTGIGSGSSTTMLSANETEIQAANISDVKKYKLGVFFMAVAKEQIRQIISENYISRIAYLYALLQDMVKPIYISVA